MNLKLLFLVPALGLSAAIALFLPCRAPAGSMPPTSGYTVLAPIRNGNLTVFPVVAAHSFDTREFLTLDEGLRSGEVIVTESGSVQPLIRRRPRVSQDGAQVNQLVLVNNSKRPLILLAGEIVTGGKQDRVIGKDRIVPAESDPVDLGVFCVEPGRWVGSSDRFGVGEKAGGTVAAMMAAPNVRAKAMADKDQQKVWSEVGKTSRAMAETAAEAAPAIRGTSSYARVMNNEEVKQRVDSVAEPVQRNYQSLMQQLRNQNAVGVVVAVNGQIVWADTFASTNLLEKYWPKLARSYAAEALVSRAKGGEVEVRRAQEFVNQMDGRHETVDSEPGLYRHTEIAGDGFRAFELTSLLPKTGFDLHVAKMAE